MRRGNAAEILRKLDEPYDMAFIDGADASDSDLAAKRLVRDGGLVVSPSVSELLAAWKLQFREIAFAGVRPAPDL